MVPLLLLDADFERDVVDVLRLPVFIPFGCIPRERVEKRLAVDARLVVERFAVVFLPDVFLAVVDFLAVAPRADVFFFVAVAIVSRSPFSKVNLTSAFFEPVNKLGKPPTMGSE